MAKFVFASCSRLPPNDTNHKYIMMILLSSSLSAWILAHNEKGRKEKKREALKTKNGKERFDCSEQTTATFPSIVWTCGGVV